MAGKRKLEHFAEMKGFPHVFEPELKEVFRANYKMKGKWKADFFKNDRPLVLELACGKGEYSVGMAAIFPEKNFIGIDIKGARMWRGAKDSLERGMQNIAFLRTRIEFIEGCFAENEVDEIWITFPDPQPKDKQEKKRLTGPSFIQLYKKFLSPKGCIHLKTDNNFFYHFTLEQIKEHQYQLEESTDDLYAGYINQMEPKMQEILRIKTHYEKLFSAKGHKIHYVRFNP